MRTKKYKKQRKESVSDKVAKTDVRPRWICVASIAKYPPSWKLANDCEQIIPQLDDYRCCPTALDKYAFFLPHRREQQLQLLSVGIFNRN